MSTPTFSVLHATYMRPAKAIAAMNMVFNRAGKPGEIEYIFAVNSDDPSLNELRSLASKNSGFTPLITTNPYIGSVAAWADAARLSTGEIMLQMSDDVEPPAHWDDLLLDAVDRKFQGEYFVGKTYFIKTLDGYRNDDLMVCAIMSRAYYKQRGEFLHEAYESMFSDDDYSVRAYKDARDGNVTRVDARDVVMLHRHAFHDKSVALDDTYKKQNRDEAYAIGAALFAQRNPEAATDGLRTWG